MCGFLYYFSKTRFKLEIFQKALATLKTRGPDFSDVFEIKTGLGFHYFGHNRLSILDLESRSNQPMKDESGRVILLFNGEIYNYLELKKRLSSEKGVRFSTAGDTEVLLKAYLEFGPDCLTLFEGMWSFVIVDLRDNFIFASRDRFGEKPLYYIPGADSFLISSQLKPFHFFPGFSKQINFKALSYYLQYQYIGGTESIFTNCFKLGSAKKFIVPLKNLNRIKIESYFQRFPIRVQAQKERIEDRFLLRDEFKKLLQNSVSLRMRSDVAIGAFFSGGVDSTLIVALMKEFSAKPINTFSIGFAESGFNEAPVASSLSAYLGTEHFEKILEPADLLFELPKIFDYWDEPFADNSQIAISILSEFARKHVKVVLSGDGADELFRGYDRYTWTDKVLAVKNIFPGFFWLYRAIFKFLSHHGAFLNLPSANRLTRFFEALCQRDGREIYRYFISCFLKEEQEKLLLEFSQSYAELEYCPGRDLTEVFSYFDLQYYLADDILVKLDRATMAHSLEARAPYLDLNVAKRAVSLNSHCHSGPFGQKQILKDILCDYIPRSFIFRPKMGFSLPVDSWLRGKLKSEVLHDLSINRLKSQGIFRPGVVKKYLREFYAGNRHYWYKIWNLWMFQKWYQRYVE
ncbi:asparagine synthase (glutamine-hydrolyzing) [Candidatus Riflebacteria bacterium]